MKKAIPVLLVVFTISALISGVSSACTNFIIKAKDKTVVEGRSMEFPVDLHSRLWVVPRGEKRVTYDDNGIQGISWTSKYGFLGVDTAGVPDMISDGVNENGLSVSGLMFPGASYQPAVPGKFIALTDIGTWILGSFGSVEEIKAELPKVNVFGSYVKNMKQVPGMHVAAHDAKGNSIVIEFIDGQTLIYDNPVGVMTNQPDFKWQMNNLRNYLNLTANDQEPKILNGVKIEATGVGSGMLGLPGDWTPPSRFVKVALCVDSALLPNNAPEAVNLAEHILNAVDIPMGAIKENPAPSVTLYGHAQWVLIKDLTNRVINYRTYNNTRWKSVDLKTFDLTPGSPKKSIAFDNTISPATNVSGQLK
ncbi:MAG: linear amide C-N hydrolase [Syntrophales bacterium]